MTKHWIAQALNWLAQSLEPVPHELNELDWKASLTGNKERLIEHLIAFANHPNGGFLVFGVQDDATLAGVGQSGVAQTVNTLANLGRDAVEPPLVIDHAVVDYQGVALLLVYISEQSNKPVHRRGKTIEEAWIRSGGTTRKASCQDVGGLMLNSQAPRWEALRATNLLRGDEILALLDLSAIANLLQRPLPAEEGELLRWLSDEGMVTPDSNGYYLTNFGAIAAARNLEQFDTLKRKRIRYRGMNKVDAIDEMMGQKGYAAGFEGLIAHLKRVLPHSKLFSNRCERKSAFILKSPCVNWLPTHLSIRISPLPEAAR